MELLEARPLQLQEKKHKHISKKVNDTHYIHIPLKLCNAKKEAFQEKN